MDLKIASWNVNSLNVRLPHVLAWCDAAAPDILALQETKLTDDRFPAEPLREAGYHSVFSGQKTYNGVAILSRLPIEDAGQIDWCTRGDARHVAARLPGGVVLHNFYIPAGGDGASQGGTGTWDTSTTNWDRGWGFAGPVA